MIKFNNTIVQFGFGAVGKSFFEKISNEIKYNEYKYIVISRDQSDFKAFINLGGISNNFHIYDISKENYQEIFSKYLSEGDLLIDFAESVGTKDICNFCAEKNIMYINTGETDWSDNWYSIFDENLKKHTLMNKYNNLSNKNKYPIILQHGNNPGLVSHFVKAGLEYIIKTQFKHDKSLNLLLKENRFNLISQKLGLNEIHINDIDTQKVSDSYIKNILYSTWCVDSFFFEMLSESTLNLGSHEEINSNSTNIKYYDKEKGFLELNKLAANTKISTYYPNGKFDAFLVSHEETITIANSLEVKENDNVVYRPTVLFLYLPCDYAKKYFENNKVSLDNNNNDKNDNNDIYKNDSSKINNTIPSLNTINNNNSNNANNIIRGYKYPNKSKILYKEDINSGTEYVGVLLLGKNFKPVWIGNRIEPKFLYKDKSNSFWQTPTITPVAMSALAAVCWMIKNKDKDTGRIYFPDDIDDYKYIIKKAEKYISKTIYKTFDKDLINKELNIDIDNLKIDDLKILDD